MHFYYHEALHCSVFAPLHLVSTEREKHNKEHSSFKICNVIGKINYPVYIFGTTLVW